MSKIRQPKTITSNTKIQKMDQSITQCLTQKGPIFPALFGRFGETRDKVHALVAVMAKARVSKQNISWVKGEDTEKPCLSLETAYLRRS